MSKWKSYLPLAIIILVGFGAANIADSLRFRQESMGIGCAIFAAVFFLYKVWSERPTAKQSEG
ncbi:hypothetical protein J2Y83_003733 [Pseudomonas marginalis]|uniref:hypothetical protein n=1 Tax=Pseudomonas marginalis TaxID=298 RepID=UPI00209CC9AD|nr:hypothetical protein [Pseudomonas marginalis]MCP1507760.1 hypothetical protein [Pseudomonas marginalis]MCP1525264.1 hypothetical protein [Pseudomonas marginalis]MDQ0500140.1 hypothetical protein [Pseudomonas marginalis]